MKLDDDIAALKRVGADANRARIPDGRTYNTIQMRGFGFQHIVLACLVGVALAAGFATFATWRLGYVLATPNDQKILLVVGAAGVEQKLSAMSAGDLQSRVLYDPSIVAALSDAFRGGVSGLVYHAGKYLAQLPDDDSRERAAVIFQRLAEVGSENATRLETAWKWAEFAAKDPTAASFALSLAEISTKDKDRVETALRIAQGVKPDTAVNLKFLAQDDPEMIKSLATMNYSQVRALRQLAYALGGKGSNEAGGRLDAVLEWLNNGKPLPKCDLVAPKCSVDGAIYGVTCAPGTYVSITPACVYCPAGGRPQRQSDGTTACNYRR